MLKNSLRLLDWQTLEAFQIMQTKHKTDRMATHLVLLTIALRTDSIGFTNVQKHRRQQNEFRCAEKSCLFLGSLNIVVLPFTAFCRSFVQLDLSFVRRNQSYSLRYGLL